MNIFVFDIETIPDIEGGRRLYGLQDLHDAHAAQAMFTLRREKTGNDFLAHHLQKIIAISIVLKQGDKLSVWSLGSAESSEKELIARFFQGLDKYTPTIISWNGSGFDLPVLHYRALVNKVNAARYWEQGEHDQQFRWNNYLNRYHHRHLDLMDILAGYQARANAPLDEIASLLGFPGKIDMHGGNVWQQYCQGEIENIRNYCETDVLNTYLVYLRFEQMRGNLTDTQYQTECDLLREYLQQSDKPHFYKFLEKWQ